VALHEETYQSIEIKILLAHTQTELIFEISWVSNIEEGPNKKYNKISNIVAES